MPVGVLEDAGLLDALGDVVVVLVRQRRAEVAPAVCREDTSLVPLSSRATGVDIAREAVLALRGEQHGRGIGASGQRLETYHTCLRFWWRPIIDIDSMTSNLNIVLLLRDCDSDVAALVIEELAYSSEFELRALTALLIKDGSQFIHIAISTLMDRTSDKNPFHINGF